LEFVSVGDMDEIDILYGDTNGNGKVTVSDLITTLRVCMPGWNNGSYFCLEMDCYKDGYPDIRDVVLIVHRLLGTKHGQNLPMSNE
jgi:hypothetical protein